MEKDIKTAILKEVKAKIQLGDINHAECLLKGYLSYEHKDPEISSILAKIFSAGKGPPLTVPFPRFS